MFVEHATSRQETWPDAEHTAGTRRYRIEFTRMSLCRFRALDLLLHDPDPIDLRNQNLTGDTDVVVGVLSVCLEGRGGSGDRIIYWTVLHCASFAGSLVSCAGWSIKRKGELYVVFAVGATTQWRPGRVNWAAPAALKLFTEHALRGHRLSTEPLDHKWT